MYWRWRCILGKKLVPALFENAQCLDWSGFILFAAAACGFTLAVDFSSQTGRVLEGLLFAFTASARCLCLARETSTIAMISFELV